MWLEGGESMNKGIRPQIDKVSSGDQFKIGDETYELGRSGAEYLNMALGIWIEEGRCPWEPDRTMSVRTGTESLFATKLVEEVYQGLVEESKK